MLRIQQRVAAALGSNQPVVALESSVFAQGLPVGANRDAAKRIYAAIEGRGVVPAITVVLDGIPTVGVDDAQLERLLARDDFVKVSARDLAPIVVRRGNGATTVAATMALASSAGLAVFATGGIGGVHRELPGRISRDESADLVELARTSMIVVCAGAKSILDLPATWERLDTLGIPVIGYGTTELPAFFSAASGIALSHSVARAEEIVEIFLAHRALGRPQALLVVQPPPAAAALDANVVESAIAEALRRAESDRIQGSAVTPYLLAAVADATGGASLAANLALLEGNAALAAEISAGLSRRARDGGGFTKKTS